MSIVIYGASLHNLRLILVLSAKKRGRYMTKTKTTTTTTVKTLSERQRWLIVTIVLSAVVGIFIHFLRSNNIEGSALLYIGVPVIIALAFAHTSKAKSVTGSTLKAITFIILMSGPLLQEGFICMIMAAPIFYIIGAMVTLPFDYYRKKKADKNRSSTLKVMIIPALLLFLSTEGVIDELSFDRHNTVEYTQLIDGSVDAIKEKLAGDRFIRRPESTFARLFPRPDIILANGIDAGDLHSVEIDYVKWIYWNKRTGKTQFKIIDHQKNRITFAPIMDSSYLSTYLTWGESAVIFVPLTENTTRVTWRINFTRDIDPAWYVQPLQQYAATLLAKELVLSLQ
ncbi:MAG: hypothetical protein ACJAZJ_000213 [Candidatus Endobugula sp.]|jgi:hypothetical protein